MEEDFRRAVVAHEEIKGSFGIGDTSNIQRRLIDHMEDVDVVDFMSVPLFHTLY